MWCSNKSMILSCKAQEQLTVIVWCLVHYHLWSCTVEAVSSCAMFPFLYFTAFSWIVFILVRQTLPCVYISERNNNFVRVRLNLVFYKNVTNGWTIKLNFTQDISNPQVRTFTLHIQDERVFLQSELASYYRVILFCFCCSLEEDWSLRAVILAGSRWLMIKTL